MKEPQRLEEGASGVVRTMLVAAQMERPSPAAIERTLISLGAGAVAASMASGAARTARPAGAPSRRRAPAAKAASVWGTAGVIKWMGVGMAGGLVAMGVIEGATRLYDWVSGPADETETAAPQAGNQAPRQPSPPGSAAATGAEHQTSPERDRSAATSASQAAPAAEVELVNKAREALKAGAVAKALEILDRYDRDFEDGELTLEADYLRMEAHFQRGDDAMARAMARQILATRPTGPHGARARAIIKATNP